jgi:DNA-binding transcriptional ArsR family regulator
MVNTNQIAELAQLVGEPARASMLMALLGGKALTASELARCANVTPQTASSHLARLTMADLLKVSRQGRHRYHRLASIKVARMLESLMETAASTLPPSRRIATGPADEAMRRARTCYDHFAGGLGVAITDALVARGAIELGDEAGLLTPAGADFVAQFGLDGGAGNGSASARPLCRPCLDWSERRPHLAGKVGAAICSHFMEQGSVRRIGSSRAVEVTPKGRKALKDIFGISGF